MSKYLIGIIAILIISIGIISNLWRTEAANAARWEENNIQSEAYYRGELSQVKLKSSEFKSHMADSTKKLLDSLRIKPKKVVEYVTIHHYHIDTVLVNIPTVQIDDSTYSFIDSNKCFYVEGLVITNDPHHKIKIIKKSYINTDQYFLFRNKEKLFDIFGMEVKKFWKKSKNELKVVSECGESQVRKIDIIKK